MEAGAHITSLSLSLSKPEGENVSTHQGALVIDSLLLLIFFLAMTIASLVILTSSPHLQVDIIYILNHLAFASQQRSTFCKTAVHNLQLVV